MAGINDDLQDAVILHMILVQRYRAYLQRAASTELGTNLADLLREIDEEAAALSAAAILDAMENRWLGEVNNIYANIQTDIVEELEGLAATEAEWQAAALRQRLPLRVTLGGTLDPNTIRVLATQSPFENKILGEWFASLADNTRTAFDQQIRASMVRGESVRQMVQSIRGTDALSNADGTIGYSRRAIESVVRTAVNSVSNNARNLSINSFGTVVKGVLWVSTLDSRTSKICRELDHKVFPLDSGPRPPAHFNCRSTVAPIVKSWQELGLDFQELPEGTRASLNGQVPARTNYRDWLTNQTESIQNQVLGKSKANAFRSGRVQIDGFDDSLGRSLTLSELRIQSGLVKPR